MTKDQFQQIFARAKGPAIDAFYLPMVQAMHQYDINTSVRKAMFLAQVAHETGELHWLREIWGNTKQQLKYEPPGEVATKLGNTTKGDGKKYMGRGCFQITGRHNYQRVSYALNKDFVNFPELLETPIYATLSAAWFWSEHHCNQLADENNFDAITHVINGGLTGKESRDYFYHVALGVLVE